MDNFLQRFRIFKHKRKQRHASPTLRTEVETRMATFVNKNNRNKKSFSLEKSQSFEAHPKLDKPDQKPVFPRYSLTAFFDPDNQSRSMPHRKEKPQKRVFEESIRRWDLPTAYIERMKVQSHPRPTNDQPHKRKKESISIKTIQNVNSNKLKEILLKKYRKEMQDSSLKIQDDQLYIYGQRKNPETFEEYVFRGIPCLTWSPPKTTRKRTLVSRSVITSGHESARVSVPRDEWKELDPWNAGS